MKTHLIHAECEKTLPNLPEKSVGVVMTSPPYNLGIRYAGGYQDNLSEADYLIALKEMAVQLRRVLMDDGSFFLNIAGSPQKPLLPYKVILALTEMTPGWVLQNTFHWVKSAAVPQKDGTGHKTIGHFKPINSKRFVNDCHEFVFHLTKTGDTALDRKAAGVAYEDKSNLTRWEHTGGTDRRCRGNTWFVPYKTIRSRKDDRPHPASFPAELAELALLLHGRKDHAMDPYNGIGNTGMAAKKLGFEQYTGIDICEEYLDESRKRISETITEAETNKTTEAATLKP